MLFLNRPAIERGMFKFWKSLVYKQALMNLVLRVVLILLIKSQVEIKPKCK